MNNAKLQAYMRAVKHRFCPPERELVAYGRGGLDAERAEEIRGHLEGCGGCRRTLEHVREFFAEDVASVPPDALEREFREVLDRVPAAPRSRGVSALRYAPLAASMLIAGLAVGWSLWHDRAREGRVQALATELRQLRAQLERQPRAHVRLVELFPDGALTRNLDREIPVIAAPDGRELVFILNAQGWPAYPSYTVELLDQSGRKLWSEGSAQRDMGNFVVSVPAGYLRSGTYLISLSGGSSKKEYSFSIGP